MCSFLCADAVFGHDGVPHLIRNANAGCPGAKYDHAEITQLLFGDMQTGQDGCQRHAPSALDVVVEAWDFRSVLFQDSTC